MNTREQYLIKQNERLQAQLQVVLAAMNNAVEESEFRASVACAFAWELGLAVSQNTILVDYKYALDDVREWVLHAWDESVADMEKESDETRGVRRASDGSIISILSSTEKAK